MPFEPWQIQILQEKAIADAAGDLLLVMLKQVENADQMTHAVVRKQQDKYLFLGRGGWVADGKQALRMSQDEAAGQVRKRSKEGAVAVVFTEKVAPEVVDQLFAADQSPDHRWSDWIFEQAGGGSTGHDQTEHHLNYLKQRFIHQYTPEAWAQAETDFRESMRSADQDVMMKMRGCFGYFRNWPGRDGIYPKVADAVTKFQRQEAALLEMNQELEQNGQSVLAADPEAIGELKSLVEVNVKVSNWIAAKRVRMDYRVATWKKEKTIYSDDFVTAIAPLTYAAAVKYGFDTWDVSSRAKFTKVAQGDIHSNPWDSFIAHDGFMVFIHFNVPTPRWVGRTDTFKTYELTNLLLGLSRDTVRQPPDTWQVTDEENNRTLTIAQIKTILRREGRAEPPVEAPAPAPNPNAGWQARPADPHPLMSPVHVAKTKDWPIKRGGQTVASEQEAEAIVQHLDACLAEIKAWGMKFDPAKLARVVEQR